MPKSDSRIKLEKTEGIEKEKIGYMKLCKDESKIPVVNSKERKKIITCPLNNLSGETSHLVTL